MSAIITLLALFAVSTVVTKTASAWLMATGLSARNARFHARSAFTGVGFTTSEAEVVVNHPIRRRVITTLMLLGNLGVGAVVAGLVVSYDGADTGATAQRTALLVVGGLAILAISRSTRVDNALVALTRRMLEVGHGGSSPDRSTLVSVGGHHDVVELAVNDGDWMCGRSLDELRLKDEGVMVLGIERDGLFVAGIDKETTVSVGDVVVVFGPRPVIEELDHRRAGVGGELAHVDRVVERNREVERAEAEYQDV